MRIGVISDTHGLLRPDVFTVFAGVEQILHAGDVGPPDLLIELGALAPVTAVYGNTDGLALRNRLPDTVSLELDGVRVVLLHGDQFGSPTPEGLAAAHPAADLVVYGHTHRPLLQQVESVTVLNPGSAGPRRFKIPPTVALLEVQEGRLTSRMVELEE